MKSMYSILLLISANVFMTFAWYLHLQFKHWKWFSGLGLIGIILISWGIAFFEYCLQVPANKIGYIGNGGPFNLFQLKILQEVITLSVFILIASLLFKQEKLTMNHIFSFLCLIAAVYFGFKK